MISLTGSLSPTRLAPSALVSESVSVSSNLRPFSLPALRCPAKGKKSMSLHQNSTRRFGSIAFSQAKYIQLRACLCLRLTGVGTLMRGWDPHPNLDLNASHPYPELLVLYAVYLIVAVLALSVVVACQRIRLCLEGMPLRRLRPLLQPRSLPDSQNVGVIP